MYPLHFDDVDYVFFFLFSFFRNSNHDRGSNTHVIRFLERHGIPYHYLRTTNENKREGDILELVPNTDFLVLARYMQVNQILLFCALAVSPIILTIKMEKVLVDDVYHLNFQILFEE